VFQIVSRFFRELIVEISCFFWHHGGSNSCRFPSLNALQEEGGVAHGARQQSACDARGKERLARIAVGRTAR
jgi:hypothetical protein